MGLFGGLKRALGGAAREVKKEYGESKDFLEAVCAGAALTAYADGTIDESEKRKVTNLIQNHSTLSQLYNTKQIDEVAEEMFRRAKDSSGRQQLVRELEDIKGRPNAAQMAEDVYLICVDVASADGNVDEKEEATLAKLANRLGVDPSKFEF